MDTTELAARIETLEIRLMHQEAAIDEMTHSLHLQEQLIHRQLQAIERLERQLQSLTDSSRAPATDDPPPPHY